MTFALRLLRNTIANYLGTIVTIATGLLLTPFIVRSLGGTLYGIWALAGSLVAYFMVLDSSLANALTKYAAESIGRGEQESVNRLASTLFYIFVAVGIVGLALVLLIAPGFPAFFDLSAEYANAARWLVVLVGLTWALGLPMNVFGALLSGYQRFDIKNSVLVAGLLLNAGLTVAVLMMGTGIIGLGVVALLTVAFRVGLSWGLLKTRVERGLKIRLSLFDRSSLPRLVTYSVFMAVMMACLQIESSTSNVIIARYMDVADVTPFAIGQKLSGLFKNVLLPLTYALFPAFSELSGFADKARMSALLLEGMSIMVALGTPLIGCLVVLAGPLIQVWVGPEFVNGAPVAVLLGLQAFLYAQLVVAAMLLQGVGRLKLLTGLHIFNVVFNIGFSLLTVERLGILALGLASFIPWTITYMIVLPYSCQLGGASFWKLVRRALLPPTLIWLPIGILLAIVNSMWPATNLVRLILFGGGAGLLYLVVYLKLAVTAQEKARYRAFFKQAMQRRLGYSGALDGTDE